MEKTRITFNPQHIVVLDKKDAEEIEDYKWMVDSRPQWLRALSALFTKSLSRDQGGFHKRIYRLRKGWRWDKLSKQQVIEMENDPSIMIDDFKVMAKPHLIIELINNQTIKVYADSLTEIDILEKNLREEADMYTYDTTARVSNIQSIKIL